MVMVVKSEWHQVEKVYGIVFDTDLLQQIYPDKETDELKVILDGIKDGTYDIDDVISDAFENDVDIEWDYLDQDDWWTDRKGGYEVTYKVEDWEYREEYVPPKTHKCTKCRWKGTKYETRTEFYNEDGSVYTEDDLVFHHKGEVCPMCDSPLELTEEGVIEEEKRQKLHKELSNGMFDEDEENVGTPPSDEEMAASLEALEEAIESNDKKAWPWAQEPTQPTPENFKLPISYPPGTYTINLLGRGTERGYAKITKPQYDYWYDMDESDLADALNENYDYDDNKTPKRARFEGYYNDYSDKYYFGIDDDCWIEIIDENKTEIVSEKLDEYINKIHTEDESYEHITEEDEFYMNYDLKPGYYVSWAQGGKGTYFQGTVTTTEVFDPRKLWFYTTDVEGNTMITSVKYGTEESQEKLENDGGDWSGKWATYEVHHIEKKK
jgi:hypothetical protein